jgi:heme exporter protein B
VLPLYIPVLIFASSAVDRAASGLPVTAQINILLAMLMLAVVLTPLPTAAALKMSVN